MPYGLYYKRKLLWPSPYISVTERVASLRNTLGDEFTNYSGGTVSAGNGVQIPVSYTVIRDTMEASADRTCAGLDVPWHIPHTVARSDGARCIVMAPMSDGDGDHADDSGRQGRTVSTDSIYYYHRDHLGSTMSVSDKAGNTIQQVEYTPWGEVFVERRFGSSGYESPYLFNGKELDEETGLYYYGARYYDPKLSVWYSVDPLALKHHNLTGYVYCRNNPLNFIDLMGLDDIFDEDGVFIRDTGTGSNIYIQNSRQQLFLLSSFDYSEGNEGNRSMLRNVAAHYLSKSDTNPFEIQLYELTPDDPKEAAFANVEGTKKYYVTLSKGRINLFLDNKYDFWSITYHEKLHRYNPNTWGGTIGEIEAIYQQSLHESWSLVSTDYVISQSFYAVSSLQKAIDNNIENLNINQQIEKINKTFIGYGVFNYNPKTKKVTGEITPSLDELIVPGNKKQ